MSPTRVFVLLHTIPQKDTSLATQAIKALGDWWSCMPPIWLVKTSLSADEILTRLAPHLGQDHAILVLPIEGDAAWINLDRQAAGWLKDHVLDRGASPHARRGAD